jgi:hypothetical protein
MECTVSWFGGVHRIQISNVSFFFLAEARWAHAGDGWRPMQPSLKTEVLTSTSPMEPCWQAAAAAI